MMLPEKFDDIIDCIERLVATGENDITQALVSETGYNKRLLGDVFQFITDISLARYICQRRLVYALKHRLEDNLSVEDICETAGYSDAAAFSKACKVRFGLSPSQITEEDLHKYMPLDFSKIVSGENAVQMENDTLVTMKDNTICGVSAEQFAEIKQVIEIGAIYGLSDEEAEFVHRLAADRKLTLDKAAEFYDDFKLQIENGSNIPNLDLLEMAEISCQYDLSYSEAQGIMYMLEGHGYHSIRELPVGFFDIYFSAENDQCGWDVPYICEIAEALEDNGLSANNIDDYAFYATMYGVDIVEAIESYEDYKASWRNTVKEAFTTGIPEDDTDGFGYKSIWEFDEE